MTPDREPKVETRALDRGLQVLSTLAISNDGLSAPDLAETLGLNRATVYRLLATLTARRFVVLDERQRRYFLGPAVENWLLGRESRLALATLAKPAMEHLGRETGETIGLFVRNTHSRICLSRIDSPHVLRHVRQLGELRPLVLGSSGIVLMWQLDDDTVGQICAHYADLLAEAGMDESDVRKAIEESRALGHATSSNAVPGLGSVALPIVEPGGRVIAALTVTGPGIRFGAAERRSALALMQRTTQVITEQAFGPF